MRSLVLVRVAWQSIRKNTMRTLLTMLGIIIGVAAVIVMVAVGLGAKQRINQQTQAAFEYNRQAYRSQTTLAQLQLALQNYENTTSDFAEANLATLQSNLEREYSSLYALSDEEYHSRMEELLREFDRLCNETGIR